MRSASALVAFALAVTPAAIASADTFGGFSGVDKPYLVNTDKVCAPLQVENKAATGTPKCEKAAEDVKAHLSFKSPVAQRGLEASFTAKASQRTLTISNKAGDTVVTWQAADPIGKIVEVYASQYEDRVAVAFTMRRLGKEVTDIVGFDLLTSSAKPATKPGDTTKPADTTTQPTTSAPVDPKLDKAVTAARKAPKTKAAAAWNGVLAIDAQNSEAQYRLAAFDAGAKRTGDALTKLQSLAKSSREDAIEWLVEARFDAAFAALRADAKFRDAVGLDRPAKTPYERLMGFGGQWEQTGTSCEAAEVRLSIARDRSFKVTVKTVCRGDSFSLTKKGTWRISDDGIVLALPPAKGTKASAKDEAPCMFEKQKDEDALHCVLDRDLEFTVLPTRR